MSIKFKARVSKRQEKGKSKNTLRAYKSDWLKFIDYCENSQDLAVTNDNINPKNIKNIDDAYALTINYLTWLYDEKDPEAKGKYKKGKSELDHRKKHNNNPYSIPSSSVYNEEYKASTIQRKLASIVYNFKLLGWKLDRKSAALSETMSGFMTDENINKKNKAKGLLSRDIKTIIDKIDENEQLNKRDIRDKSLILLCFFSFCRRSEIINLRANEIKKNDDGGINITITKSKTDQKSEGREIYIGETNDKYCPVKALYNWLKIAEINNDNDSDPLFFKINKGNKIEKKSISINKNEEIRYTGLTDTRFVNILKKRAEDAGYSKNDIKNISGHSLRIGAISQARKDGFSNSEIMKITGHKTEQMITEYTQISSEDMKKSKLKKF